MREQVTLRASNVSSAELTQLKTAVSAVSDLHFQRLRFRIVDQGVELSVLPEGDLDVDRLAGLFEKILGPGRLEIEHSTTLTLEYIQSNETAGAR